jgi:hypothetical protein
MVIWMPCHPHLIEEVLIALVPEVIVKSPVPDLRIDTSVWIPTGFVD